MSEFAEQDDDRAIWEEHAHSAVERAIEGAELDEITGTVAIPAHYDDPHGWTLEVSSLKELERHLCELYNQEWYAYVPFEEGEAIFKNDAWDAVGTMLSNSPGFAAFFERHAAPKDAEELATAGELILDHNASLRIRVTLEEINDELVAHLAKNPPQNQAMNQNGTGEPL